MRAWWRWAASLLAAVALAGCFRVETLVVERDDAATANAFLGEYYGFDDLPEAVADWSGYKGKQSGTYEVARDPHIDLTFLLTRDKNDVETRSYVARAMPLSAGVTLAQLFTGEDESLLFLLRREGNGIVRVGILDDVPQKALRRQFGFAPDRLTIALPEGQPASANRDAIRRLLDAVVAHQATKWPILMVPRRLVDG